MKQLVQFHLQRKLLEFYYMLKITEMVFGIAFFFTLDENTFWKIFFFLLRVFVECLWVFDFLHFFYKMFFLSPNTYCQVILSLVVFENDLGEIVW